MVPVETRPLCSSSLWQIAKVNCRGHNDIVPAYQLSVYQSAFFHIGISCILADTPNRDFCMDIFTYSHVLVVFLEFTEL